MSLVKIQKRIVEREKKYFEHTLSYVKLIKTRAAELLGEDVRLLLFGSIVRKDYIIGGSDIDVLIISENAPTSVSDQAKLRTDILKFIGDLSAPFEIHFSDISLYENWYKRHIKDDYFEIK